MDLNSVSTIQILHSLSSSNLLNHHNKENIFLSPTHFKTRIAGCCASCTEYSDDIHLKKKVLQTFKFFKLVSLFVRGVMKKS